MLASPVQVAVGKEEARHAEHALGLGGFLHRRQLARALAVGEGSEAGRIGAGALQHVGEGGGVLDVEIVLPEPLEDLVVVGAEDAVPLGVQQPDAGQRRIPDLARAADGEPDAVGLAPHVHVAVLHPAPLVGVAVLLQDAALGVDLGAAEIGGNVEDVGQPVDRDAGFPLQPIGRLLGQIGVGALVVDVERQGSRRHGGQPRERFAFARAA